MTGESMTAQESKRWLFCFDKENISFFIKYSPIIYIFYNMFFEIYLFAMNIV